MFRPTVLITRPEARVAEDSAIWQAAGWRAVSFCPMAIEPVPSALAALSAQYAQAQAVFWVSPTAVQTAIPLLCGRLTVTDVPNIAVGRATAAALEQAGCRRIMVPDDGQDSEAVLRLPVWQQLPRAAYVLIVRGEGGRTLLSDSLQQQGFQVALAEIYRRKKQAVDWAVLQDESVRAVWVASAETARLMFEQVPQELVQKLKSLLYFTHHSKISAALQQLGVEKIEVIDRLSRDILSPYAESISDE